VGESHPLMLMLDELKKEERDVRTLMINNLQKHCWEDLLTDTLKTRKEVAKLALLLYEKTNGNPFFTHRLLDKLKEEGQFTFNTAERKWTYDMDAISSQPISDNVAELLSERIRRFPVETQQILKRAAYIGNRFDLAILSIISEQTEEAINKALEPAISEGIITTAGETYLFVHDLIQQTAYQLAGEGEKEALHLHIGRLLLNQWSGEQRLENIFTLADHLNAGQSLIQKEEEKIDLSTLNLQAGTKAKETGAFAAVKDYFLEGVRNLPANSWETNYRLTFDLNKGLADADFLNGNFEKSEELIHETLSRTKLAVEKAEMYNILLMLHTLKGEYEKAKNVGKHALNLLGFQLPEDNLEAAIEEEIVEVKKGLGNRSFASLFDAPDISDPGKKQVGLLLGNMVGPCYASGDLLWAAAITKLVNLALEFGNIPEFVYGYAEFGVILSFFTGDYQSGYDLGKLSIELCNRYHNRSQLARACQTFGGHLLHWIKPAKQALPVLNDGYQAALESGELQYAGYICCVKLSTLFSCSYKINPLLKETKETASFTKNTQNQIAHYFSIGFQLVLNNLSARTKDKFSFHNNMFTEADFLEQCKEYQLVTASCVFHILIAGSSYLHGNPSEALQSVKEAKKGLDSIAGLIHNVNLNLYHSLSLAELHQDASPEEKGHYLEDIRMNQGQLKTWADHCPENFMCRYLLVEAELARICGKDWEAVDLYEQAIKSAQDQEFVHMEALGNELASKFWLSRGKEQFARLHLENAYYLYQRWGAYAKVKDLESRYRHLLTKDTARALTITQQFTSGRLDLETLINGIQILSAKLDLQDLLNNIMDLMIAHSGAERALLILKHGDDWLIQAMSDVVTNIREVLPNRPFRPQMTEDLAFTIPEMVFRYCLRSKETLVSGNALQDPRIQKDRNIWRRQIKSMVCIPILNHERIRAMIYLENNLIPDVFSIERMGILQLLSTQFSISIENAMLYHDLKQNADTIRKSEERYKLALAGTSAGIWDWDINSGKVFLSGRLKELLGYSADEFLETLDDFWDRLHPEDKKVTRTAFVLHLKEHVPYDLEYRLKTKSGDYHWFNARGQAVWDETGKATRMSGSIIEITRRKHAEEDLKRAFEEIKGLKERLEQENIYLREEMGITHNYGKITGQSKAIKKVLMQIKKVAHSGSSVFISGETGTGKELIANAIHNLSDRKDRPMVKVNCAALPSALIESELFGREKGAYTGALSRQVGRFEIADNSTIFLDEIGELSPELQAKLLRVIQDGEFERLGSPKTIKVNVRVIAATNRDLEKAVAEGRFREDLFYRLNVFPIRMPPLRERMEDIPALVWAFVKEFGQKMGKNIQTISKQSIDLLQQYKWPGNIRELRNVIEHAMLMSEGNHLKVELPARKPAETTTFLSLEEMEREHIKAALKATGWRVRGNGGAAELLQIKPTTLYSRMEKLGIQNQWKNWGSKTGG
jgi:PAS domain S-box-containing protein